MTEPTITCPNCKTEIKLTESLAAPLIESTRRDFEKRLALKDSDIAKKEEVLREREEAVTKAKQAIDDQVAEKLSAERAKIVTEESKKAKLAPSADQGPTLEPVAASLAPEPAEEEEENQRPERVDVEKVFGKLGGGSIQKREDDNRP